MTTRITALLLGTMLLASPALAQSGGPVLQVKAAETQADVSPAASRVDVEIQVVHANNSGKVDPQLAGVVENLSFLRYSGFKLLDTHPAKLGPGQETTFNIAGGRKLKVTLVSRDARAAKIRVLMSSDKGVLMDTTVSIHRNRAFIIAGPSYEDGKLVLPLTVRY